MISVLLPVLFPAALPILIAVIEAMKVTKAITNPANHILISRSAKLKPAAAASMLVPRAITASSGNFV